MICYHNTYRLFFLQLTEWVQEENVTALLADNGNTSSIDIGVIQRGTLVHLGLHLWKIILLICLDQTVLNHHHQIGLTQGPSQVSNQNQPHTASQQC